MVCPFSCCFYFLWRQEQEHHTQSGLHPDSNIPVLQCPVHPHPLWHGHTSSFHPKHQQTTYCRLQSTHGTAEGKSKRKGTLRQGKERNTAWISLHQNSSHHSWLFQLIPPPLYKVVFRTSHAAKQLKAWNTKARETYIRSAQGHVRAWQSRATTALPPSSLPGVLRFPPDSSCHPCWTVQLWFWPRASRVQCSFSSCD